MKTLGSYKNGNTLVELYSDGTRIQTTDDDNFIYDFPNSFDFKITNQCNLMCKYCHEDSIPNGKHADIMNMKFIDTLRSYTEIALGGGNPLSHPDLISFLEKLKERKIIANITVNQKHFMENIDLLLRLTEEKLIYGLGVSLTECGNNELKVQASRFPNLVWHVINGVVDMNDLYWLTHATYNSTEKNTIRLRNVKILILGYKNLRRGSEYYSSQVDELQKMLYNRLPEIMKWCKVVSFDNLGLKQLNVKRLLSDDEWNSFYQGGDGLSTLFIDGINNEYATSSTSTKRYKLLDSIDDMFNIIKHENRNN